MYLFFGYYTLLLNEPTFEPFYEINLIYKD